MTPVEKKPLVDMILILCVLIALVLRYLIISNVRCNDIGTKFDKYTDLNFATHFSGQTGLQV